MIDQRFGHGTWVGIVTERAKRIQEAKEAALAARKEKAIKQEETMETIKMTAIVLGVIAKTGERYLPAKAIKSLTSAEYSATTKAKRQGTSAGKQHVSQPKSIAKKTAKFRRG